MEKLLLIAEVRGDEIIVRTLGFYAAYAKSSDAPQLVLRRRTETNDHELLNSIMAGRQRQGARAGVDRLVRLNPCSQKLTSPAAALR